VTSASVKQAQQSNQESQAALDNLLESNLLAQPKPEADKPQLQAQPLPSVLKKEAAPAVTQPEATNVTAKPVQASKAPIDA